MVPYLLAQAVPFGHRNPREGPSTPHSALTGQGSSQVAPSQPGVHEQEPSTGLQAAPLAQVQLSLQFRPHVPLGHGRLQSGPCQPMGRKGMVCHLSLQAQLPADPSPQPPALRTAQTTPQKGMAQKQISS